MAAPPTLSVKSRGSNVQVYRITGGTTATQIGNNVSATVHSGTEDVYFNVNHVVQFGNDLYLWHGDDIYKYNSGTGNWDAQSLALDMKVSDGYRHHTGLYHVSISGVPYLFGAHRMVTSGVKFLTFDGSSWSESSLVSGSSGPSSFGRGVVFRNSLFMPTFNYYVQQYDPVAVSLTRYAVGNYPYYLMGGLLVFGGELYASGLSGSGIAAKNRLYRFSAGAFNYVQDLGISVSSGTPDTGSNNYYGGQAFFTDGTDLFCILPCRDDSSGQYGNVVLRLVVNGSAFDETDLSDPVLPAALRLGGGVADSKNRWVPYVDNETDPASPVIHFFYQDDAEQTWSHYQWNGVSSEMTSAGGGLSSQIVPCYNPDGGGARFWTSGELNIQIVGTEAVLGGEKYSFKAYGDSGNSDKTVKFYYDAGEEVPKAQATLKGAVTGGSATRNGNQIENVDADDGATTYTCIRDVTADGFVVGDKETIMPLISV